MTKIEYTHEWFLETANETYKEIIEEQGSCTRDELQAALQEAFPDPCELPFGSARDDREEIANAYLRNMRIATKALLDDWEEYQDMLVESPRAYCAYLAYAHYCANLLVKE